MTLPFISKIKLLELLIRRRVFVARAVSDQRLRRFFERIVPYKTDRPLVRIGGDGDGGYLVPDDLEGLQACFSPGVSQVASFELALAQRSIPSYMADYSVDNPPCSNPLFDFEKKYLGTVNDDVFTTLPDWMEKKAGGKSEFILQMDIEGAEYGVILHASEETLRKFRIIVIEFHNLENLFVPAGIELIELTFARLLRDFEIVHIHPNNCSAPIRVGDIQVPSVMEFTFLRRDRISRKEVAREFPHRLDVKNMPDFDDVQLPVCWRGVGR